VSLDAFRLWIAVSHRAPFRSRKGRSRATLPIASMKPFCSSSKALGAGRASFIALFAGACLVSADCVSASATSGPASPPVSGNPVVPEGAIDPDAKNYPYPFAVHEYRFEAQRQPLVMAYLDVAAEHPNGKTAVLLHGKNFSAAYWAPTIRSLTAAGFRVIAPDQIGFGKSSKPSAYQYSFAELAGNTRALLASIGISNSIVVGHSMGGMLAIRYALSFRENTDKLVLVDPIGLEDYGAALPYRSVDELYRRELTQTADKIRAYESQSYFGGTWKPEYEELIALPAGWTRHPAYATVAWAAALTTDMILTQPVVHDLPRIQVPVLFIIGQRDRAAVGKDAAPPDVARSLGDFPALGKKAARAVAGARLVEIPNAGHLPQIDSFPAYEKALLSFLLEKN
jgi:pimeloyl-ACP methyl ester carboxylesterase